MKKPTKSEKILVDAVSKALMILECFSLDNYELSLKQISDIAGLYPSRTLRLCGTLIYHGFLIRDSKNNYRIGPKLLTLGKIYERKNPLIAIARPILRELCSLTGESCKLFAIDGTKRLCLAKEESPSPLRYSIEEGQRLELYAGAGGKAILAFCQREFQDQVLKSKPLKRLTANTIVEADILEKEFQRIQRNGFAESHEESIPGVASIAAPIFDHSEKVCASLTIAGPIQRFDEKKESEMIKSLLSAAKKLSKLMGYTYGI
jgi:DNA-binding IclR family transcriptional regulator